MLNTFSPGILTYTSYTHPKGESPTQAPGTEQLSNQAYERIREMIAAGAFPPATPIREVDLVRQFEMSRTPVREALHRLEAEGLIRALPIGGFAALELGPKELTNIYGVREVLTGLAARLAAQSRTRIDIARLEDALDAMDRAVEAHDADAADASIREFYYVMSGAGGNTYLQTLLSRVVDVFRYHPLAITHPGWHETSRLENREILAAIVAQEPERAESLARKHMARALETRIADFQKRGTRSE